LVSREPNQLAFLINNTQLKPTNHYQHAHLTVQLLSGSYNQIYLSVLLMPSREINENPSHFLTTWGGHSYDANTVPGSTDPSTNQYSFDLDNLFPISENPSHFLTTWGGHSYDANTVQGSPFPISTFEPDCNSAADDFAYLRTDTSIAVWDQGFVGNTDYLPVENPFISETVMDLNPFGAGLSDDRGTAFDTTSDTISSSIAPSRYQNESPAFPSSAAPHGNPPCDDQTLPRKNDVRSRCVATTSRTTERCNRMTFYGKCTKHRRRTTGPIECVNTGCEGKVYLENKYRCGECIGQKKAP
jgi:hypothetical protein